jgi:uncharacterized protein (TIGR03067 family)
MLVTPSTRLQFFALVGIVAVSGAVFLATGQAGAGGDKTQDDDLKRMQGDWNVAKITTEDGTDAPEDALKDVKMAIKGDKLLTSIGGEEMKISIKIDQTKKPKEIDVKFEGKDEDSYGIYEIEGDSIRIAVGKSKDMRPKDFKTQGSLVITLKRTPAVKGGDAKDKTGKRGERERLVAFQDVGGEKKKSDKDLIQGTWRVEETIDNGEALPPEFLQTIKFVVTADKIDLKAGELILKASYTVDETKKPKTLDLKFESGMDVIGIYEFAGNDKVRFCLADAGKERPKEFASAKGSEWKLVTLKRFKDEPKDEKKDEKKDDKTDIKKAAAPARTAPEFVAFVDGQDKSKDPPKDNKDKSQPMDKDLLKGTWQVTSAIQAGMKVPDEEASKIQVAFKDGVSTVSHGAMSKDAKFTIDQNKKPKQMDIVPDETPQMKIEAIYELTGDKLKICTAHGGPRPTEFKSDPAATNIMLMELNRVPQKQEEPKTEQKKDDKDAPKKEEPKKEMAKDAKKGDAKGEMTAAGKSEKKADEKPAGPLTDAQRIVGAWKLLKARGNGEEVPPELVSSVRMLFESDGRLLIESGQGKESGKYGLEAEPKPGHIDFVIEEKKQTVQGIYKFDTNRLLLCFPDPNLNQNRPTEFKAEKGTNQVMFVLEQTQTAAEIAREKIEAGERGARNQSANNLKQIGLAMHNYHDTFNNFPAHAIYSKDGKTPLLSWRVAILPYIEQVALYQQFKLDEPWDSEHNKKLIAQMPKIYEPVGLGKSGENRTYYQVVTGPKTLFNGSKMARIASITDGTSNTILAVEAKDPVIWTKPDDVVLPPKVGDKMPELGGMFTTGMNLLFCDGSIHWVRKEINPPTLRALISPAGGEVINLNEIEQ